MLATTGGISPIARCSKSFVNAPCGGTHDGRCEIKRDTDCTRVLILERMRRLRRMYALGEVGSVAYAQGGAGLWGHCMVERMERCLQTICDRPYISAIMTTSYTP